MPLPPAPQPPQFSPAVSLHQNQQKQRINSPRGNNRKLPQFETGFGSGLNGSTSGLMSASSPVGGMLMTRMTNGQGQSIDIYENPSEHYVVGVGGPAASPIPGKFLPTMQPATFSSPQFLGIRQGYFNNPTSTPNKQQGKTGNAADWLDILLTETFLQGEADSSLDGSDLNPNPGLSLITDDEEEEGLINDSSQKAILNKQMNSFQNSQGNGNGGSPALNPKLPGWRSANYSGSSSLSSFSYSPRSSTNNSSVSNHSSGKNQNQNGGQQQGSLKSNSSSVKGE